MEVRASTAPPAPAFPILAQRDIVVRGNLRHPSLTIDAEEAQRARTRAKQPGWTQAIAQSVIAEAEPWLRETDAYWLSFLPKPGACYAYGFTGSPIDGSRTGTWENAHCSWDLPGKVRSESGDLLPDAAHPDHGRGYVAPDGRIYYFVGQFNAWVVEQWSMRAIPALARAYLLTGDERYAQRAIVLFDALASIYKESTSGSWDYPSTPPSGRFARPWYQVARALIVYANCYDWLYHSPALALKSLRPGVTRRENIEQNLLLDGGYYCYRESWDGKLHNGHADYLRGALTIGCLLDVPAYVDAAVNGPLSIQVMIANNLDRDGGYYETSLGYGIHARNLYLTFGELLMHLRNEEYPHGLNLYRDPRLRAALTIPDLQLRAEGRRPNFGDSAPEPGFLDPSRDEPTDTDYVFAEELLTGAETPAERREAAALLSAMDPGGDPLKLREKHARSHPSLLWQAADLPGERPVLPDYLKRRTRDSWVAGMKGIAFLRTKDQAALLRFGPTLNHGGDDDLGLLYYTNGYEMTYAIGYSLASTHVKSGWSQQTASHALVTVNERSQHYEGGSGGSLRGFADLPHAKYVDAESPLSYSSEGVHEYRRRLVLSAAGYLVDCFQVEGGTQHDYGFGSIGADLTPFGVTALHAEPGSLAPGYEWGEKIGNDGDIAGHPNQPYWNAPPGNGYGFFYRVRRGTTGEDWGGTWRLSDFKSEASSFQGLGHALPNEHVTHLRVHHVGDAAEPVFAQAPGLYPWLPSSSFVLARRRGANLKSTFLAVYEPFASHANCDAPRIKNVRRLGPAVLQVDRADGGTDVFCFGPGSANTGFGRIDFDGEFALLTREPNAPLRVEASDARSLRLDGRLVLHGPGKISAKVVHVDPMTRAVDLDVDLPAETAGLVAIFSNPAWSRTSAYSIARAEGRHVVLQAASLSLGIGRVSRLEKNHVIVSDIPHDYARSVQDKFGTRFFDGKELRGHSGGDARVQSIKAGDTMAIAVNSNSTLQAGETFEYLDLSPGDRVEIALPAEATIPGASQ